jgi:hypothetical protein
MKKKQKVVLQHYYPRITHKISDFKPGDTLFTATSIPEGEVIFWKDSKHKKDYTLHIGSLRNYLELLELLILNNRIIIGYEHPYEVRLTPKEWDNKDIRLLIEMESGLFRRVGVYSLKEQLEVMVKGKDIIIEAIVTDKEVQTPDKLVDRYLSIDQSLQKRHESNMEQAKYIGVTDKNVASDISHAILTRMYGATLYLSECCRRAGISYWLHPLEEEMLANYFQMENTVKSSVINEIKTYLDRGAQRQIEELAKLGVRTVFPQTPIASMILINSNKPEDINTVALQLREEYKQIRAYMTQIQEELWKEDTSLERKIKISKELQKLCSEIWPEKQEGWRAAVEPVTGFLNLAIESASSPTLQTVPKAVDFIVKQPFELITRALRRRKLRVLLEAKKNFLRSSNWSQKLAHIFNISEEEVKTAQLRYSQQLASPSR